VEVFMVRKVELQKLKPEIENSKKKSRNPLTKLKRIYLFLAIILVLANAAVITAKTTEVSFIKSGVSTIAGRSVEVIDSVWQPTIKNENGLTGVLVMGIDARKLVFDGTDFGGKDRDIDSIMQVVVNNKTGEVFILSIPRDTGVTITEECAHQDKQYYKSINHAYKLAEDGKCPGGGAAMMMKYVSSVTGIQNQYYAIISYDAFKEIIKTVGVEQGSEKGLIIDVPRNIQEYYPREVGGGFESVYFPKGQQFISADRLLKYSRSRKASSDFDRAARQQQVMKALEARVMASDLKSNPSKVYELYKVFQSKALFSELTLDDIRGAMDLATKVKEENIHTYVLDDNFGGLNSLMTRPIYSGKGTHNRPGYYLSPVAYKDPECLALKDEYCKVKEYVKNILEQPDHFSEKASIFVYSNVNNVAPDSDEYKTGIAKLKLPYTVSKHALPGRETWGNVQIYDFSDGKKDNTKQMLQDAFGVDVLAGTDAPFKRANNEDFAIIVKMN
jgi:LCP family protein required for cell wall assembly